MEAQRAFPAENHHEDLLSADRELAAFLAAVTKLYGEGEARQSAEDWLAEARQIDHPPSSSSARDWRSVTVAAAARLAARLNATSPDLDDRSGRHTPGSIA